MKIYFEYPENATQARTELISMGIPERAVRLDIHEGGGNPVQGATIVVDEADWLRNEKVIDVAHHHDGKIRD